MTKRLREIIQEIEFIKHTRGESPNIDDENRQLGNHISTTPSGHQIFHHSFGPFSKDTYQAYNPKTKQVDLKLRARTKEHENGLKTLSGLDLVGRKGSSIKGHELYHHLITHHNYILQSDHAQTKGGLHVWKQLHKMKDIHVHGWHQDRQTPSGRSSSGMPYFDNGTGTHISRIGHGHTHASIQPSKLPRNASHDRISRQDTYKAVKVGGKNKSNSLRNLVHKRLEMTLVAHKNDH